MFASMRATRRLLANGSSARLFSGLAGKNFMMISQLTNAELEDLVDHAISIKEVLTSYQYNIHVLNVSSPTPHSHLRASPMWLESNCL